MITVDLAVRHDENEKWQADFNDTVSVPRTGSKVLVLSKTVGTTAVTLSLADLSAPGYAFAKNIGSAGNISFGYNDGTQRSLMRLAPGQFAVFPVAPGLTLGAVADQANSQLLCVVYEA